MTLDNPTMTRDDEIALLKVAWDCKGPTIKSSSDENFYARLIEINKPSTRVKVYHPGQRKVLDSNGQEI